MSRFICLEANIHHSSVLAAFQWKFFKISGVCLKITYLMTNQSLFAIFKHNILLIKILANVALKIPH